MLRLLRLDFLVAGLRLDIHELAPLGRAAGLANLTGPLGGFFGVTHTLTGQDVVDMGVHRAHTFR